MVEEQALIVAVSDQYLTLSCETKTSCGSCQARQVCGHGALAEGLAGAHARQDLQVALPAHIEGLSAGDRVLIGISGPALTRSSTRIYLWPLLALIVGMGLGQSVGSNWADLWSMLLGGGFFYAVFRYVILPNDAKLSKTMEPSVIKKLQA